MRRTYTITVRLDTTADPDRLDAAVESAVQWSTMREALMAALDGAGLDADLFEMSSEPVEDDPSDADRLTCDHCDRIETAADLTPDWNPDTGCHRSCEARIWAERGPDDDDLAAAGMIGEGGGGGSHVAAWRESDEAHR